MKVLRIIFTFLVLSMLAAIPCVLLFHLGPSLCLNEKERVRDTLKLKDGSKMFLAQKPNGNWGEPFSVYVYRVLPDGRVARCLVGYEESYWWFAKLRMKSTNVVDIRACGQSVCNYDLNGWTLTWNDNSYPPRQSEGPLYLELPFLRKTDLHSAR
jgi:hypothetical protein